MAAEQQELVDLEWDWGRVADALKEVRGASGEAEEKFFAELKEFFDEEEGPKKKGVHFFAVRYRPGAVIMAKGTTSDYAAVHLSGLVRVRQVEPEKRASGAGCWDQPRLRRLEDLLLNTPADGEAGRPAGRLDRLLARLYRTFPGLPLWLIDFTRRHLPQREERPNGPGRRVPRVLLRPLDWLRRRLPPGGEEGARRLQRHVARLLRGQLPAARRLERRLARPAPDAPLLPGGPAGEDIIVRVRDDDGRLKPVARRLMGVTGTLWNQPRTVTLVADDDPEDGAPCRMLLIKRRALLKLVEGDPGTPGRNFLEQKLRDFIETSFPDILAANRLFRDKVYPDDVADWGLLLECLRGRPASGPGADVRRRAADLLEDDLRDWLHRPGTAAPGPADHARVVSALNRLLADRRLPPDGLAEQAFPEAARDEARRLLARRDSLTDCEACRLNRLLFEAACPGAFHPSPRPWPLFREEFEQFARDVTALHREHVGTPLQPEPREKGQDIYREGDEADCLHLLLSGMVRVVRRLPGGQTAANNLDSGGYFGEGVVDELTPPGGPAGPAPRGRRAGSVLALCQCYLLRLDRAVLRQLAGRAEYAWLLEKLRRERRRVLTHNQLFDAGWLLPPREPPPPIADKLVLTRNVLLIDLDRCTRCDQCVRGCAAAHDGQPRFHRANPEMRFGKWEVAAACMHCLDAPCLQVCPVGAITFLEDKAVQIHRTRCIGCTQCSYACPFGVIDMYPPVSPEDAPNLWPPKLPDVATKCDLCLTEDRDPPCVAWCPYDAARRADPVQFFHGLRGRARYTGRPPAPAAR